MKLNKYLKELDLEQEDLPNYYNPKLDISEDCRPGADPRNEEDEEGFSGYEFFNLDRTLNLFVYSKLCYYREHIADLVTPGELTSLGYKVDDLEEQREAPHKLWLQILDEIIEGFKISIVGYQDGMEGIEAFKVKKARHLLAEYWDCLWY